MGFGLVATLLCLADAILVASTLAGQLFALCGYRRLCFFLQLLRQLRHQIGQLTTERYGGGAASLISSLQFLQITVNGGL
ncbi:hypothetical protein FQZ97_854780 [compost metagenome]